ncbi:hypothetical protein JF66_08010 [Cryobacterium sp. MLB-32]|nr:hypothetical protein JF66_08010 [Cryobacterium sp. MLB-32]
MWRLALLVASVLWLIGLNAAYLGGGAKNEWLGLLSVIPIWHSRFMSSFGTCVVANSQEHTRPTSSTQSDVLKLSC